MTFPFYPLPWRPAVHDRHGLTSLSREWRQAKRMRKEPRYQVAYHTYAASGRRLSNSYTPSVECVVGWKYAKRSLFGKFSPLSDYVMLTWEMIYQALPALPYWNLVMYRHSSWEKDWGFTPNLNFKPVFTKFNSTVFLHTSLHKRICKRTSKHASSMIISSQYWVMEKGCSSGSYVWGAAFHR